LLRCHPSPKENKFVFLENLLGKLKLSMKFTSVKDIQTSLENIFENKSIKEIHKQLVSFKMVTILEAAKYFVVDDVPDTEWRHFALNFDIYTHFTSPIRRYPDVFVHRLLETCLKYGPDAKSHVNKYDMLALMSRCNKCKLTSRRVNDSCEKIFMCLYLKNNSFITKGLITTVSPGLAMIYIPHLDTEIRLWLNELNDVKLIKTIEKDEKTGIKLHIRKDDQTYDLELFELDEINVYVKSTDEFPIDYKIHFVIETENKDGSNTNPATTVIVN